MAWLLILSIFLATDTVEVKGTTGLSYRLFVNQDKLCFQYKFARNWSVPTKLDSGDISEYQIVITTGDYLHVAYIKNQRVCYRTTLELITKESIKQNKKPPWSTWVFVSPYFTEPASNISIGTESQYLYVIWHAPTYDYPRTIEIWKRRKSLNGSLFEWSEPICLSK